MTTMKVLIVYDERVIAREVLTKLREALGEKYKVSVESVECCHAKQECTLCNTIKDPVNLSKHRKLFHGI